MGGLTTEIPTSQLRPPPLRPGVVERASLLERLTASPEARIVTIVAPAGYGKTTLMSLWTQHETRQTAWLSVDKHDNDPAILLANIVAALEHAGMINGALAGDIQVPSGLVVSHGVARMVNALESDDVTGILMLDHLESLRSRSSNDTVAELAARLPSTVQLVVASRTGVRLPLGLLRAEGALLELTASDLAMNKVEARELLANSGVDAGDRLDELMDRTEGWAAGLYLVGLAVKAGSSLESALRIGGQDRFLADYMREELLGRISDAHASFLVRTSILDRFCGSLCDAVLGVTGSARTIEWLEASNLLIVPLDRTRDWYRYHHLLHDFLQAELVRTEPDIVAGLHTRAAHWFDANEMPEDAIAHAQAADDGETVAQIVRRVAPATYALGRAATAFEWLRWFEQTGRIGRYPDITALGAWACALSGDEVGTDRWANALFSNGELSPSGILLRALLAGDGIDRVRADTQAARQAAPAGSGAQAAALTLEGLAELWDANIERAEASLAKAVLVGERLTGPPVMTVALAGRAVIALDRGGWDDAEQHVTQSQDLIGRHGLDQYVTSGLTFAVATRCAVHRGEFEMARHLLAQAATVRPLLTATTPGISVQTLLEMAKAHLALSDVNGARSVVRHSADILAERPDLGNLTKHHDEIKDQLDTMSDGAVSASALTTAELRLLPFLGTHLSFPEIGERLYISRHTVKTQAMSIYRKLGASSRSEAVQHAAQAGLLAF